MAAQGQQKSSFVTKLTDTHTSTQGPKEPLGCIREEAGKKYKYVLYDNGTANLTMAAGNILCYLASDTTLTTVSVDESDCFDVLMAGVAISVIPDGGYGWMQIAGLSGILTTDIAGTPAVGRLATMSSTDDTLTLSASDEILAPCWIVDTTASAMIVYLNCWE